MSNLKKLLRHYHALESGDHRWFQPRARLLQSIWREEQGYEAFKQNGKTYGAWLPMPWAKETLANYLTETIREVVREEVIEAKPGRGRLFGEPRIYNNLLSSQPLCFNLFGELQRDLDLATSVVRDLTDGRVEEVTEVRFEYSPGRGDDRYTGDRSAFDVFLETKTADGGKSFVGIEVKYHENLQDPVATHRPRYDEVAELMGCFAEEGREKLRERPLQQIWRDHLLAGALLDVEAYDDGFFVFLHAGQNTYCTEAVAAYQVLLNDQKSFVPWTLARIHGVLENHSEAAWVDGFRDRYLAFEKVEERME